MKAYLLLALLISASKLNAQADASSQLYKTLKLQDSLIFDVGFNNCKLTPYDTLVSDDLEFYHDKGGITYGRAAFIASVKNNICGGNYKMRRELVDNSLQVFPLYNKDTLYGAIQSGIHKFFVMDNGKWRHTSTAKFTHLWLLNNNSWQLKRVLSYDHL